MDTLVLNADGLPLNFLPLSTINWQEAIRYMVLDKANVIEWHENWIVRSVNWQTLVPSIIMLKTFMNLNRLFVLAKVTYSCVIITSANIVAKCNPKKIVH